MYTDATRLAETSLLGAVVLDGFDDRLRDELGPDDFGLEAHGKIYSAMCSLAESGRAIDYTTIADQLGNSLEQVGGCVYLSSLTEGLPRGCNIIQYAKIIKEASRRRELAKIGELLQKQASDPGVPLKQIVDESGAVVSYLRQSMTFAADRWVCMDTVTPENVKWLWDSRIPLGKLTVLDGDPGLGKSTVMFDIAARVTRDGQMPDGTEGATGSVLVLSAEDGLGDTIRPRLSAAGANLSRVTALNTTSLANGGQLFLPDHAFLIGDEIERIGASLVILDPLMAFLHEKINSWSDQQVRSALTPLAIIAANTGAAVVVIRHLNKAAGASAIYRGGGSIGIIGAARSGLVVGRDPDCEDKRVLAVLKSNLARIPESLTFALSQSSGASRVEWLGGSKYSADDVLAFSAASRPLASTEAQDFLQAELNDGPKRAVDVEARAKERGISARTLKRAKQELGIRSRRDGYGSSGGWLWVLPDAADEAVTV